jgi:tripartite-type tricarboxylate transporter receptor subunit TctC
MKTRIFVAALSVAAMTPYSTMEAQAEYPEKTIRLVAPFPPGGGVDRISRVLAHAMGESM